MYTVGESATLYAGQAGQYYANTGTTPPTGYNPPGTHYLVQQAVDPDGLIASRNSPQTTTAVSQRFSLLFSFLHLLCSTTSHLFTFLNKNWFH